MNRIYKYGEDIDMNYVIGYIQVCIYWTAIGVQYMCELTRMCNSYVVLIILNLITVFSEPVQQ